MNRKISFVPLAPPVNAATRTFCVSPAEELRPDYETKVYLGSSSVAFLRASRARRRRVLASVLYWYGLVLPRRLVQFPALCASEVVLIQRSMLRYRGWPYLEGLLWFVSRLLGRPKIVLQVDDALYVRAPKQFRARVRFSDAVVTGNESIAAEARRCGGMVRVIETGIPIDEYLPNRRALPDGPVTVLWVGTNAREHLTPVLEPLLEICDGERARLVVVSDFPYRPESAAPGFEFRQWSIERHYTTLREADIGLMPLEDNAYNRGKEAYKLKEYMAAGLPAVASPVGHNTRVLIPGVTGLFASSPSEWADAVAALVNDPELRDRMGRAARALAAREYPAGRFSEGMRSLLDEMLRRRGAPGVPMRGS